MSSSDSRVRVERDGAVLQVVLDRPEARNAIDLSMARAIEEAMDLLDEDDSLTVGVLSATGQAFCAGMDLKAFAAGEVPRTPRRGFAGLTSLPPRKPLVGAVEGVAVGGGFEMVLSCDLVVASTAARFGLPEVKRGVTAAGGGLMRLPRRIPTAMAMEMILTGDVVDAATAANWGLLNRLVEPGEALSTALDLARAVALNAPLSLVASKRIVTEHPDWPIEEAFDRQEEICDPVRRSEDAREGARAFAEKRPAAWRGL